MESDLSSNQFITESLIQSINEHTNLDKLEQEVNQLLSQLNSKSSLRKRYDSWIKNKTYPDKIDKHQKWISDYDQTIDYLKQTLDNIQKKRRANAKDDYEYKLNIGRLLS